MEKGASVKLIHHPSLLRSYHINVRVSVIPTDPRTEPDPIASAENIRPNRPMLDKGHVDEESFCEWWMQVIYRGTICISWPQVDEDEVRQQSLFTALQHDTRPSPIGH